MTKPDQFCQMMQTAIIIRHISDPAYDKSCPMARPMWSLEQMDSVFKVANRIPEDVSALNAAEAFTRWMFRVDEPEPGDAAILKSLIQDGI